MSAPAVAAAPVNTSPSKGLNIALWVVQVPLRVAFGMARPGITHSLLGGLAAFVAWGRLSKAPLSPRG